MNIFDNTGSDIFFGQLLDNFKVAIYFLLFYFKSLKLLAEGFLQFLVILVKAILLIAAWLAGLWLYINYRKVYRR